ncbi:MAG: hypothetical protein ACK5MT_18310 [Actinomycetales bacterium]
MSLTHSPLTLGRHPVRLAPAYRLVNAETVTEAHLFVGLDPEPGAALLVPDNNQARASAKLVDRATAELLTGAMPSEPDSCPTLAALVLDGVLVLDLPDGPVTGPRALQQMGDLAEPVPSVDVRLARHRSRQAGPRRYPPGPPEFLARGAGSTVSPSRLGALSLAALGRAHRLASTAPDPMRLAHWLYACNSMPATPGWAQTADHLDRQIGEALRRGWLVEHAGSTTQAWVQWHHPDADLKAPTCKLYTSVHPADRLSAFRPWVEGVARAGARAFKAGRGAQGLLRPDGLVAYFDDPEVMLDAVEVLRRALDGCRSQGVPFTADVPGRDDALFSWGIDPPRTARLAGWDRLTSWRSWITARLARLLTDADAAQCTESQTTDFVNARLRLDGVDPTTWTPPAHCWRDDPPSTTTKARRG